MNSSLVILSLILTISTTAHAHFSAAGGSQITWDEDRDAAVDENELPQEDNALNVDEEERGELFDLEQWGYVDRLSQAVSQRLGDHEALSYFQTVANKPAKRFVKIEVNNAAKGQFMNVYIYENDVLKKYFLNWKVSTGRPGKLTKSGKFKVFEMNPKYFSRAFGVILPWGMKFDGGNLIHSTVGIHYLGKQRSAGCVRLSPQNAQLLFGYVRQAGMKNTSVIVNGDIQRTTVAAMEAKMRGTSEPKTVIVQNAPAPTPTTPAVAGAAGSQSGPAPEKTDLATKKKKSRKI